jgi:hypothetical protein
MAELWQIPEIKHWWLPNDEGYLPILRNIRSFIEERGAMVKSGDHNDDLQSMKAIFAKLNIDDATTSSQRSSPQSGSASDAQSQSPIVPATGQQRVTQGRDVYYIGTHLYGDNQDSRSQSQGYGDIQGHTSQIQGQGDNQGHTGKEPTTTRGGDRMSGVWTPGTAWPT